MDAVSENAPKNQGRRDFLKKAMTGAAGIAGWRLVGTGDSAKAASPDDPHKNLSFKQRIPVVAHDQELPPGYPDMENFNWSRDEVLFAHDAGFQKLREGGTVSVYIPPEMSQFVNEDCFASWNKLGIELRGKEYFTLAKDQKSADITFIPTDTPDGTYVAPVDRNGKEDYENPFYKVNVFATVKKARYLDELIDNQRAAHELGHAAFGFVDFLGPVDIAYMKAHPERKYHNPQDASNEKKPYLGVMNNMKINNVQYGFRPDDKKLLVRGDYANAA